MLTSRITSTSRVRSVVRTLSQGFAGYGLLVAIVMFTPVTERLALPLYEPASPPSRVDTVVVMEAWAERNGELNESGLRRSLRGADAYRDGAASVIVLTGLKATIGRSSALQPMVTMLRRSGVPDGAIVVEDQSRNTHESAIHVAALAKARGWQSVVLVTDATHMRRAAMAFQKQGLHVANAPTMMWSLGAEDPALRISRARTIAQEYAAIAYYWWRDWI